MTLAAAGWSAWWAALVAGKMAPDAGEVMAVAATALSVLFALPGLLIAALALRSRRTWMLFVLVPLFANGMLLMMPWLASELFAARN